MKKRTKIWVLLNRLSSRARPPRLKITGCATGQVLYEGSLFQVPFGLCCDYVKDYRLAGGILEITSTCSMYETEGNE